jgi:O-antigen/teichoic acid export membrane protein
MIHSSATGDHSLLQRVRTHVRSPLYRNSYALTISAGLTSLLGMGYWLLAARLYDADTVGANSAAVSAMMFLSGLAGLYLEGAFVRFIPAMRAAAPRFARVAYTVSGVAAITLTLVFLWGIDLWSPALGFLADNGWLAAWFVAGVAGWCIFVQQDGLLTGLRRTTWIPVENTVYALAKLVLLVALAPLQPRYGIFVSWVLPALLLLAPINWLIFRRLLPQHVAMAQPATAPAAPITVSQIAAYVSGNYLGQLFSLAYIMLPPIMVLQVAGSAASAYFYLPWMIGGLLRLVAANMSTSLIVEASLDIGNTEQHFRRARLQTMRLVAPLTLFVVLAAPHLLHVFGPDYADEGSFLLRLLALATVPSAFISLYGGLLRIQNRIRPLVAVYALTAVLTLTLSALLLPVHGINGVGIAWLASQIVAALVLYGVSSCKNCFTLAPTD